ncbi:MAG: polysaccharide deacetylase family protein [Acidobacteriota bacterium]|nr:polysaccharide deacetylase family protein [Acidobacteriota bacterium]
MTMNSRLKLLLSNANITKLIATCRPARTIVLMYHDLRTDDDFENWLRVSNKDFDYQLMRLKQVGDFIGPDDLFSPSRDRRPRFLITFDDGYRNNIQLAAPILRKYNAPALFFISTRHMQEQLFFWPDVIVTPLQALQLDSLDLRNFDLGQFQFRPMGSPERWDDIQVLLVSLKNLGNTNNPTVAAVLRHMQKEYAEPLAKHLPRFRPINSSELKEMSREPLFHFGSHAHHHDILTFQKDGAVDANLKKSQSILEELTGRRIKHLAYPNGNCDARIIARAERIGYTRGYVVKTGIVNSKTSAMVLPRLGIGGIGHRSLPFFQLNRLLVEAILE